MRFLSHFSMAVALATAGTVTVGALTTPLYAKEKKQKKPKLSKEFSAVAGPVQKAITDNAPEAKAQVEALLAQPWTGIDADFAGQLAINLGATLKDTQLQEKGINKRLEAGFLNPEDTAKMLFYAGSFARERGDHATAERQLKAAIAAGYPGPGAHLELANGYSAQKQPKASLDYLSQAIDIQRKSGASVPEDWYRASRDRARATKDQQLYAEWAAKWAAAYPSPESWADAVTAYRLQTRADANGNLEVLRFMKATGSLTTARDYKEFAEEAQRKNLFGEVVAVLEDGKSKDIISSSNPLIKEVLEPAQKEVAGDRASLPAQPSGVRGSGSSSVMMNFADVWLGYKGYDKAVAFYEAGLTKPEADMNRGYMGIGTAHAYAGDYDAAKQAFAKVSGTRAPLAAMWQTWIDQQTAPAPVAPAAAEPAS